MDIESDAALLRSVAKHGYTGAAKLHGVSRQRAEQVTKEFYRCALLVEKGVSLTTLDEIRMDIKKVSVMVAERQMSWGDLAKNSGLARASLSQIKKRGSCRSTTIGKIANALGVAVEDLIIK
jgi:DNA-binding Xre family transcriptional regulator